MSDEGGIFRLNEIVSDFVNRRIGLEGFRELFSRAFAATTDLEFELAQKPGEGDYLTVYDQIQDRFDQVVEGELSVRDRVDGKLSVEQFREWLREAVICT